MLNLLEKTAAALIRKYEPIIICVTGSVGKTSTKEAIACTLSTSFRTRKTSRNYNNDFGVPISVIGGFESEEGFLSLCTILAYGLWQLCFGIKFPEVLILEVGAGKVGEIERIAKWLKPNIVVVTNLPHIPSHLGVFGSKEMLIKEKKFLISAMDKDGVLIIDKDEANTEHFYGDFPGKIIFCNGDKFIKEGNYVITYRHKDNFTLPTGFRIEVCLENSNRRNISFVGFLGIQNMKAIDMAILVAKHLNCTANKIQSGLQKYRPQCGRLRIIPEQNTSIIVLDDTFNASPYAVENSVSTLISLKKSDDQRRIAVLGDMLNLGKETENIHRETAIEVIPKVDILITVGNVSKVWQEFNADIHHLNKHFKNSLNAAHYIENIQKEGDLILFKGGHLTRLEKAVAFLTKCPLDYLVRQETYYNTHELDLNPISADHE